MRLPLDLDDLVVVIGLRSWWIVSSVVAKPVSVNFVLEKVVYEGSRNSGMER